jgi:non-ribosomal peptide synthetase component F
MASILTDGIVPMARLGVAEIPLAPAQRRFWFLNRLEGPTPNYNELAGLRFRGEFNRAAVIAALQDVIGRHEILRTIFPERDGVPRQQVLPAEEARLEVRTEAIDKADLTRFIRKTAEERFDLRREMPLRAVLIEFSADDHLLLLVLHHIAMDAGSMNWIFVPELLKAYVARSAGTAPELPPVPVQYADYTLWQLATLGREDDPESPIARQIQFWRNALSGLPEHLYLPADRPRRAEPSFRGATLPFEIDARLHASVLQLGRVHRSTSFMILHAALAALLTRLGAGTDIPMGTPISRRPPTLNQTIGCFANTLVVRADTSGNPAFLDLLQQVRRKSLSASMNAELSFDRVVEAIAPRRALSHNPVFEVLLGLFRGKSIGKPPGLDALVVRMPLRFGDRARFDLALDLIERRGIAGLPGGIIGTLQYRSERFDAQTAQEFGARLVAFLESIVSRPAQRIGDVDLFDAHARAWSLVRACTAPTPAGSSFWPDRFEQQARHSADAVAVVCDGESRTYGDVNRQANRLAQVLACRGIACEDVVAVAVPRSLSTIVVPLAAMKAGAAFLLLDIEESAATLAQMLDDARPRIVVTTAGAVRALPPGWPTLVLDDPAVQAESDRSDSSDPPRTDRRTLGPDSAMYVAHTAGTAGRRRGVIITHDAGREMVAAAASVVASRSGDRVLAATSVADAAAILELIVPLLNGGTVVLATTPDTLHSERLAKTCELADVTLALGTPRLLRPLLEQCGAAPPESVVVRGELVPGDLCDGATARPPRMSRLFGLAEHTVCAGGEVGAGEETAACIGSPVGNARLYVLDGNLQPVPAGVPGELYAAGPGLARGYVGAAALTSSRFVADPFGAPGGRMVRTGDVARWRRSGELELLGRAGEDWQAATAADLVAVESALRRSAEAEEAAAILADRRPPGRPIGYVTPRARRPLDLDSVRERLSTLLPGHLVPDALVVIPGLPLTGGGRLDRAALPTPAQTRAARREPRSQAEARLCRLFAEALKVETVGPDDDFFELGGYSMLAMQVVDRAQRSLGLSLDVRALFEAPTPARLARRAARGSA